MLSLPFRIVKDRGGDFDWHGRPVREPRRNTWKTRALAAEALVSRYRELYGDPP